MGDEKEESFIEKLKSILLQSSVILESFGNAKTVRNDNSSRFGKYIKLMYSSHSSKHRPGISHPILSSAFTETFLLEKSRLVNVGDNERNYHIFYQLCSDPSVAGLDAASNYRYLSSEGGPDSSNSNNKLKSPSSSSSRSSTFHVVDGIDDRQCLDDTLSSIQRLGFTGRSLESLDVVDRW